MARREQKSPELPKHLRETIAGILGPHIFTAKRNDLLMQTATAVLDAKAEVDRLRILLEALRGELRVLAAIQLKQRGLTRLILTRKEFEEIPPDIELNVECPEEGVRIYELRPAGSAKEDMTERRADNNGLVRAAVSRILQ